MTPAESHSFPRAEPAAILLVEDEPVLRASIARGIGKLPNVEVLAAANYQESLTLLASRTPQLVVSDIDLPDGSGVELASELSRRGIQVPVVFVTAHLAHYRARIPRRPNVVVLEKPVPINELRACITQLLGYASPMSPFSVVDYVQLACLGHHSVRIDVEVGASSGTVLVFAGEVWSAVDERGTGVEAFARVAFEKKGVVTCSPILGEPGPRNVDTRWELLLMDAARAYDEAQRSRPPKPAFPPSGVQRAEAASKVPSAPPKPKMTFDEAWNAGVEALLQRDFRRALAAFRTADALRPGDPRVHANLRRLEEMGIEPDEEPSR